MTSPRTRRTAARGSIATLVAASLLAAGLPLAHLVAPEAPTVAMLAVVLLGLLGTGLGLVGFSWRLTTANAFVAVLLLPAIVLVVTVLGGP
ncbi:hypothetical protein [Pseudokineococcus sp. 1T1Z-3]|uniref:hypothetical protein n=1 Tax=Pseudokineococcus sp. 1T1Z-3 TaxID=3132745 RepID=UPI00309613EE